MGSVGGKNQQNQNFIYYFFSSLGTSNLVTVDVISIHSYNMGDKIRRMSINVAF